MRHVFVAMIAALLIFAPAGAQTAPTLAAADALSPRAAGALLLAGREHAPIATVREPPAALRPPGTHERELIEAGRPLGRDGCIRRNWRATFQGADVTLTRVHAVNEVALARRGGCDGARYAHVNPGLEPEAAVGMLRTLAAIAAGRQRARFACTSERGDAFCAGDAAMRRLLSRHAPWAVMRAAARAQFFVRTGDGMAATVSFNPAAPHQVRIDHRVPPPA